MTKYLLPALGVAAVSVVMALASIPGGTQAASAQDNLAEFGGHEYQVVSTPMSWHEAVEYCEQEGAHLVTINSAAEDSFVYDLAPVTWLGATDEVTEGTWVWVTGEPFDYTNWAPGEPTTFSPEGTPEHYLAYWGAAYPGQWNDMPDTTQPFVCEFESSQPITVSIDIKPGTLVNAVNLSAKGVVPVALLGSNDFHVSSVELSSLRFGPFETAPVQPPKIKDVNGDGQPDIIAHFRISDTGLTCNSTSAALTAITKSGTEARGVDSVKPVCTG